MSVENFVCIEIYMEGISSGNCVTVFKLTLHYLGVNRVRLEAELGLMCGLVYQRLNSGSQGHHGRRLLRVHLQVDPVVQLHHAVHLQHVTDNEERKKKKT